VKIIARTQYPTLSSQDESNQMLCDEISHSNLTQLTDTQVSADLKGILAMHTK